ncbi:MAG: T9SS type A sorting domain-containing protein, partial [candidate division WOR-3 bacterium]
PPAVVLPGTFTPSSEVANYGTTNADNFRVIYHITKSTQLVYAETTFISLTPGQVDTLEFPDWTVSDTGHYIALSRTEFIEDVNPANDEKTREIWVRAPAHDVGVCAISNPVGQIPPGPTTPQVYVKNYGTFAESDFDCVFTIEYLRDQLYAETVRVTDLIQPGESTLVSFPSWNAVSGAYQGISWSLLSEDSDPTNDTATAAFEVIGHDVGVSAILAPTGEIGVGFPITPKAEVKNYGNSNENFPVIFQIYDGGLVYADTQNVTLSVGATDTVEFADWTPTTTGIYNTIAWSELTTDQNPSNDTATGTCEVVSEIVRDVGVVSIIYPVGNVPPSNIRPRVRVKNFGNVQEASFKSFFKIFAALDQIYSDSVEILNLGPREEKEVTFASWLAIPGDYTERCSTYLAVDENPENDTASATFSVSHFAKDVGVIEIIYPTGTIQPGTQVEPRVKVHNFGDNPETFKTYFRIFSATDQIYTDSLLVENLAPNTTRELTFSPWLALSGSYNGVCNTALTGDVNPANDTLEEPFTVIRYNYDVGPIRIVSPVGIIQPGNVAPACSVYNFGNRLVSFYAFFKINSGAQPVYLESTLVSDLPSGRARLITFPSWIATVGDYTTITYTGLVNDEYRANDTLRGTVRVQSPYVGWQLVANVPMTPENKRIKSGGGMTKCGNYLYILKGNNTRSMYKYLPGSNLADYEDSVPPGASGKKVKKGSGIVSDGRYLYIFKGANTKEFFRYDTERGETIWLELPSVLGEKGLKGGTGVCYLSGYIYLLKGSNTTEFYRFNISERSWETMTSPPRTKGFKDGSCLVAYNDQIYLLGNTYNNFYRYNPGTNSWDSLRPMPLYHPQVNRKKKVKEGAALALKDNKIYAFKGGNTGEFWMYNPEDDSWYPKDTIPRAEERKRVKGGGALATFGTDIWALKGNNTTSIWKYTEGDIFLMPEIVERSVALNLTENKVTLRFNSPTKTPFTVSYHLTKRATASLKIYNSLGELVYSGKSDKGEFTIKKLPVGIYLLRFESKGYKEERKLIVVK